MEELLDSVVEQLLRKPNYYNYGYYSQNYSVFNERNNHNLPRKQWTIIAAFLLCCRIKVIGNYYNTASREELKTDILKSYFGDIF